MPTSELRFPARFDADLLDEHLERSTPASRTAGEVARRKYERDGIPRSHLKPCEAEGRDGNLPHCFKVYVPHPDGFWGMVFEIVVPLTNKLICDTSPSVSATTPRPPTRSPFTSSPTGS
jgi:hypothetical protein